MVNLVSLAGPANPRVLAQMRATCKLLGLFVYFLYRFSVI